VDSLWKPRKDVLPRRPYGHPNLKRAADGEYAVPYDIPQISVDEKKDQVN
jgi:transposase